jgi:GH35 family endo-1,4-beta-xylanase
MATIHGFGFLSPENTPIGIRNLRLWDVGVTWKDLNPSEGVWVWDRMDLVLDSANHSGAKDIMYVLGMTPQWAAKHPNAEHFAPWIGPGTNSSPKNFKVWDEYVTQVVTRYKGQINSYQIWNEPQLKDFWYDYADVTTLAKMTKRAYKIIKRIDPKAKVIAAPVLPRPSSGGMRRGSKYLLALKDQGWPVDVFTCHVYPEKGMRPLRWKKLVEDVVTGLNTLDAPTAPLMVTETNYNLLGGAFRSGRKIRRYVRLTNKYANQLKVEKIYWYAYGHHTDPNVFGIVFNNRNHGELAIKQLIC